MNFTALSKFKEMRELARKPMVLASPKSTGIPKLDDANKAGTAQSGKVYPHCHGG